MKTEQIKAMQAAVNALAANVDQSVTHGGLSNVDALAMLRGRLDEFLRDAEYDEKNKAKQEENERHARDNAASHYETIAERVAALQCDFDRLEELREERKPFCAGFNMPGYMPDSEPVNFETWAEAAEYIAEQMTEAADNLDEDAAMTGQEMNGICPPSTPEEASRDIAARKEKADELRKAAEELRSMSGTEYGRTIGQYHYFITAAQYDGLSEEDFEEYQELKQAAGEFENSDDARQAIEESALSVEVRSGWYTPGGDSTPEEFCILLSTGGPACRIRGELDHYMQPRRAWIEYQDWFTPWIEYHGEYGTPSNVDQDTLIEFASVFYFGE